MGESVARMTRAVQAETAVTRQRVEASSRGVPRSHAEIVKRTNENLSIWLAKVEADNADRRARSLPPTRYGMSYFVNKDVKRGLGTLGYSEAQMKQLKPADVELVRQDQIRANSPEHARLAKNDGADFKIMLAADIPGER